MIKMLAVYQYYNTDLRSLVTSSQPVDLLQYPPKLEHILELEVQILAQVRSTVYPGAFYVTIIHFIDLAIEEKKEPVKLEKKELTWREREAAVKDSKPSLEAFKALISTLEDLYPQKVIGLDDYGDELFAPDQPVLVEARKEYIKFSKLVYEQDQNRDYIRAIGILQDLGYKYTLTFNNEAQELMTNSGSTSYLVGPTKYLLEVIMPNGVHEFETGFKLCDCLKRLGINTDV